MSDLTREQHIFIWKTQGGNYSWPKWAAMHGIPVSDPDYFEKLKQAAQHKPLPQFKQKRRRRK